MDLYKRLNVFTSKYQLFYPQADYSLIVPTQTLNDPSLLDKIIIGTDKIYKYFTQPMAMSLAEVNSIFSIIHGDCLVDCEVKGIIEYITWLFTTHLFINNKRRIIGVDVVASSNRFIKINVLKAIKCDTYITTLGPDVPLLITGSLRQGGNAVILITTADINLLNTIAGMFRHATPYGTVEGGIFLVCHDHMLSSREVNVSDKLQAEIQKSYDSKQTTFTYDDKLIDRYWIVPRRNVTFLLADTKSTFNCQLEYQNMLKVTSKDVELDIHMGKYMYHGIRAIESTVFSGDIVYPVLLNKIDSIVDEVSLHREDGLMCISYSDNRGIEYNTMLVSDKVFGAFLFPDERLYFASSTLEDMITILSSNRIYLSRIFVFLLRYKFIDSRNSTIFNSTGLFFGLFPDIEHFYGGLQKFVDASYESAALTGHVRIFIRDDKIRLLVEDKIKKLNVTNVSYDLVLPSV